MGDEGTSKVDWRSLFSAAPDQTLKFYSPLKSNGKTMVAPPREVFEEGEQEWRNAVVVQFVGRIPNFSLFQRTIKALWGKDGDVDLRPAGHNLFIIQFQNSEMRNRVLESGLWHIQNKPLIVRKWEPGMRTLDFNMAKLPLWIQLSNIPLELFTQRGIGYIASALGNSLYMDRITANKQRVAYAKVCIEVEACKEVPRNVEVVLKDGTVISVFVEVPWMPAKCSQCGIFGHNDKGCPSKKVDTSIHTKVWVPKTQKNVTTKEDEEEGKEESVGEEKRQERRMILEKNVEGEKGGKTPSMKMDKVRSGSVNRFEILQVAEDGIDVGGSENVEQCEVNDVGEARRDEESSSNAHMEQMGKEIAVETRKGRAPASAVAELMKNIKPKKKGSVDKAKKGRAVLTASGGKPSNSL